MTPILIAQVSDIHLGFTPGDPAELNQQRLDAVAARLRDLVPAPDCLIVSGDLTEHGDPGSFERVRAAFADLAFPVGYALGNHDLRDGFAQVFPDQPLADGFLQYVRDLPGLRLIVLDTLDEGHHGGAFCAARAGWLAARLAEAPAVPTLVILHHPPVAVGIEWMDAPADAPWIARLAAALADAPQVIGLACGHLHRAIATSWQGRPLTVCPSTSPEVALELAPVDPDRADDRALITVAAPGFALHRWDGERLVTHVGYVGGTVVARYTPALQPMIHTMMRDRDRP